MTIELAPNLQSVLYNPLDLTLMDLEKDVFTNKLDTFTFLHKGILDEYRKLITLCQILYEIYPEFRDDKFTHSEVIYQISLVLENFPFWILSPQNTYLVKLHLEQAKKYGVIHTKRLQAIQFTLKTLEECKIIYPASFQEAWIDAQRQKSQEHEF